MNASLRRLSSNRADGQILVVFALSMVVMISITGLALDGGSSFAQRRDQQTASDMAALAAANDYLLNNNSTQAIARAQAVAASNGYTNGVASTVVGVTITTTNGVEVTVVVDALHRNAFLGAVGMATWQVSTTASALAGFPDTASGAGPFIFSIDAFENNGTPKYQTPTAFGETNGDVPTSGVDFAWTNYGTGNVNTNEVSNIITGGLVIDKTLAYGEYIGQQNSGNHTALFSDVNANLQDVEMPVAVVDSNGNFMGWATFHVINATGGSSKDINGYFVSSFESARLSVGNCAAGACPRYLGSYVLKLTN